MEAPPTPVEQLGLALANARKRRRLTQQQLADRAGVSRPTVMRAEAGHAGLGLATWASLLSKLDPQLLEAVIQAVSEDPNGRDLAMSRERLPRAVRARAGSS